MYPSFTCTVWVSAAWSLIRFGKNIFSKVHFLATVLLPNFMCYYNTVTSHMAFICPDRTSLLFAISITNSSKEWENIVKVNNVMCDNLAHVVIIYKG